MVAEDYLFVFVLVLTRIVGLFLFIPFFSHNSLPVIARAGLAASIALMVVPMVEFGPAYPTAVVELALWLAKELAVGLAMGFAVKMIFFVLDFASHILTVEIGLMPSPEFDPSNAQGANPLGTILYFLGLMVVLSGSEYDILRAFLLSYEVAPIGYSEINPYVADEIVVAASGIFRVGILMAAPVIAVNFLINLVFAVLGKVVPRLNVFILSFSVRIIAGTGILMVSTMLIVHYITNYVDKTPEQMLRFIIFRP